MLLRSAKFILVLALACSIGLHWAVFQSLAWTSMLAGNLRRDSLMRAVTRTFDGQHPCSLCKAIADGKKSEKNSEWKPSFKSFEFPMAPDELVLTAPDSFAPPPWTGISAKALAKTPPTPPPRCA